MVTPAAWVATITTGTNTVYSDASGVARTSYIPGQRPSGSSN